MLASYDFGKTFVQDLNAKGEIDVTGVFEKGVKTKVSKPKPKPKPKPNSKPKGNIQNAHSQLTKQMPL